MQLRENQYDVRSQTYRTDTPCLLQSPERFLQYTKRQQRSVYYCSSLQNASSPLPRRRLCNCFCLCVCFLFVSRMTQEVAWVFTILWHICRPYGNRRSTRFWDDSSNTCKKTFTTTLVLYWIELTDSSDYPISTGVNVSCRAIYVVINSEYWKFKSCHI